MHTHTAPTWQAVGGAVGLHAWSLWGLITAPTASRQQQLLQMHAQPRQAAIELRWWTGQKQRRREPSNAGVWHQLQQLREPEGENVGEWERGNKEEQQDR